VSRIHVTIDELVLRGVDARDAEVVAESIRREVERRLARAELAQRVVANGHRARVTSPPLSVAHGATPRALGRAIATGIVRGVTR